MQKLRRYHYYLGVFFAPLIILFALSGALQTFRLHEEKGWGSEPPTWFVWMASIHRDSKLPKAQASGTEHAEAAKPAIALVKSTQPEAAEPEAAKPKPPQVNKLPMQMFMVVMSVALLLSSLLGITIALNSRATRRASLVMLALGSLVPLALVYTA